MKLKAIMFDVDGVLTPQSRPVLDKELEKMLLSLGKRMPVAYCSGKPLPYLKKILSNTETFQTFYYAENGGVFSNNLIIKIKNPIIKRIKNDLYGLITQEEKKETILTVKIRDKPSVKKILEKYKDKIYWMFHRDGYVDIVPNSISKKNALKHFSNLIGVSLKNIAVVSDSENDREMLDMGYSFSTNPKVKAKYVSKELFEKGGKEIVELILKEIK